MRAMDLFTGSVSRETAPFDRGDLVTRYTCAMAATDPERRREIAASGGRARAARTDHETLSAAGKAGARVYHSPANQARRLVEAFKTLSRTDRAEIRAILKPILPRDRTK